MIKYRFCLAKTCVMMIFSQIGADAEDEDNISEQKRQRGKRLLYGQTIQVN